MSTDKTEASVAISLNEFFDTIDNGSLGQEAMERLRDTVERVRNTGRKGYVQLRLNIEPAGAGQVEVEPEVKSKEPKTSHAKRVFYTDDEGHMYREDPRQMDLPLRKPKGADEKTARSVQTN